MFDVAWIDWFALDFSASLIGPPMLAPNRPTGREPFTVFTVVCFLTVDMDTQSYFPVPAGVCMQENFLSLDDILLSQERLPVHTECTFPRLGFLDKSTDSQDITEVEERLISHEGFWRLTSFVHTDICFVVREQRWSFLCGCPKVCTRGRGGFCPWSCRRSTEKAGGPCSTQTPTWWTCTGWDLTTTASAPRCCTLTARRTRR